MVDKRLCRSGLGPARVGWGVEPQLNYRLNDRHRLVAELRLNEFEQRGSLESTSAGFGVEATF